MNCSLLSQHAFAAGPARNNTPSPGSTASTSRSSIIERSASAACFSLTLMRGRPQDDGPSATIALMTCVVISSLPSTDLIPVHSFAPSHIFFASRDNSMTSSCGLLPVTCNGCDPRGKPNSHTPGLAAPSLTLYDQFPGHSFQVFRFCSSNWKLCWTLVPVPLSPDLTTVLLQWRFIIPRFLNPTFSGYQFYTPQLHHLCASIIASHDLMQSLWCHCYCAVYHSG